MLRDMLIEKGSPQSSKIQDSISISASFAIRSHEDQLAQEFAEALFRKWGLAGRCNSTILVIIAEAANQVIAFGRCYSSLHPRTAANQ